MNDSFSGVLLDIADIAGSEAAEAFEEAFGGRRIYIPSARNLRPDHAIAKAVGYDVALKIAEKLTSEQTGSEFDVPLGNASHVQRIRNSQLECIEVGIAEGRSAAGIAASCGCTARNVWRIKNRLIEAGIIPDDRPITSTNPKVFAQIAARKVVAEDLKALRSVDTHALKEIAAKRGCSIDIVREVCLNLRMGGLLPYPKVARGG